MVVRRQSTAYLDRLFGALADATRRDILARVMASVSELAARYRMSFAAVQKHVAVLERAHLVTKQKDGRAQRVAGNPDAVRRANRLLEQFEQIWQARIDRLDTLLAERDVGVWKVPLPFPRRTLTALPKWPVTTSGMPSSLKSPT